MEEARPGRESEWPAIVDRGTRDMPRPARQRIAEIGASGNAVLGVRIGVVRLDPERLDRLQFEYKFQSLRARRLDIVIGAERAIRADAGVGEAGHEIDLVPGIAEIGRAHV